LPLLFTPRSPPPFSPLFPYTTLFRSQPAAELQRRSGPPWFREQSGSSRPVGGDRSVGHARYAVRKSRHRSTPAESPQGCLGVRLAQLPLSCAIVFPRLLSRVCLSRPVRANTSWRLKQ